MAKNYATIYQSGNDAIALEQKFFVKEESVRGTFVPPVGSDFFYTLAGGAISLSQAVNSSPHKTGRHHNSVIAEKKVVEWNFPTFFNVDVLAAAGVAELDSALRVLHKSMWGKEDTSGVGVVYSAEDTPDVTFTLLEVGDKWSKQAVGAFVQSCNMSFPGDGQSQMEWSGNAKDMKLVGLGQSGVNNSGGNTVTVGTGEGVRFPEGSYVMIIENDGLTRSADTPDGSPRKVVSVTGDIVTLDGAVLADADGSVTPIYLSYYEPESPTAIDNPLTGLQGSYSVASLAGYQCVRSLSLNAGNNHELVDYCFGSDTLSGRLFVPGERMTAEISIEQNLNEDIIEFYQRRLDFNSENIELILGDATGRHVKLEIPKAIFSVPPIPVPETGSIPVSFEGQAYQTGLDLGDEIKLSYL